MILVIINGDSIDGERYSSDTYKNKCIQRKMKYMVLKPSAVDKLIGSGQMALQTNIRPGFLWWQRE